MMILGHFTAPVGLMEVFAPFTFSYSPLANDQNQFPACLVIEEKKSLP
jgi:hypothetical protein